MRISDWSADVCSSDLNVVVELWDHHDPLDSARNDALAAIANRVGVEVVATNNVHYATPAERRLATALAAVRAQIGRASCRERVWQYVSVYVVVVTLKKKTQSTRGRHSVNKTNK